MSRLPIDSRPPHIRDADNAREDREIAALEARNIADYARKLGEADADIKKLREALRTVANDPRVPADLQVMARTTLNPRQG